jgi:hypothetical protein
MPEEAGVDGSADNVQEQQLLQMAAEADATGKEPEIPAETAAETPKAPEYKPPEPPEPKEEAQPEQPELKPAAEKERDEKGRFKPQQTKEGEAPKPVEVQESEYRKAQRDLERRQKTWRETEQEKQEARAERARIQQERQAFEAEKAQQQLANLPRAQKDGFTAPDYAKAAQDFANEGDYENAFRAFQTERELIEYEQQWYAQNAQEQQRKVLDYQFQQSLEEGFKLAPDARTPGTPINQALDTLLKQHPYLYYIPEGGLRAVEITKMQTDNVALTDENTRLKAENEELKAQNGERERKSQPLRSGPTTPGGERRFEDMTPEEQEAHLMAISEEADSQYARP